MRSPGYGGLERVDLVHILGGGYINGIWPHHLALVGAARKIASRYGARVAMTGAGLIPLAEGSGDALGSAISQFDVVDVRDEASYSAIRTKVPRATLTADDALLSLGGTPSRAAHGSPRTMLCIQSDHIERPLTEIADYVVRTLQAWGADTPTSHARRMSATRRQRGDAAPGTPSPGACSCFRSQICGSRGCLPTPASVGSAPDSIPTCSLLPLVPGGVAIPVSKDYYRTKHESLVKLGSGWALADDLTEPVRPPKTAMSPFGGRLSALRAEKRKVAQQVTALIKAGRG